jgi:hypothetical protein
MSYSHCQRQIPRKALIKNAKFIDCLLHHLLFRLAQNVKLQHRLQELVCLHTEENVQKSVKNMKKKKIIRDQFVISLLKSALFLRLPAQRLRFGNYFYFRLFILQCIIANKSFDQKLYIFWMTNSL